MKLTHIFKYYSVDGDGLGPGWKFWRRRRYIVAFLAFLGFFNVYALRVNLSVAIVAMTTYKNVTLENGTTIVTRDFDWDSKMKGLLLSSFFYGYIITQIPGGWLAARIGGNRVYGIGIAVTAVFTILTPPLANISVYLFLAIRIIEGLFEGVTYPCIHGVWARWAPPLERSKLATLAFSGSYVGTVVSLPVSGILAEEIGWPSVFYVFGRFQFSHSELAIEESTARMMDVTFLSKMNQDCTFVRLHDDFIFIIFSFIFLIGTIGIIWFIIWWIIVKSGPEEDPKISPQELKYIQESLGTSSSSQKVMCMVHDQIRKDLL
ncbi:hypothetical protein ANN_01012 [Periplaneta americana]|uniref:Major facilitator superfamily (MFS) profile domain-containing protein n=1 Tax=Periplaneta americana TaxID=6978 RepID=A0ABQ8TSI6_PERAM|nr:hypothetical protein ANN_01012 [Periplaneta americana]